MTNRYKYTDSAGEHLHTLDGRPLIGTSRVGSILAKPLSWYGAGKAVEVFGCPDPKVITKIKNKKATVEEKSAHYRGLEGALAIIKQCDVAQYAALVDKAYRAHDVYKRTRAPIGKNLHAELERFIKDHMAKRPSVYDEKIQPFIDWTFANVKRFLWSEGHCYSEQNWIGGICDVGYERKDGVFGIGDFKSAKDAYFEHFTQIGGYDIQISENGVLDANGNLQYTLETPIGEYIVVPFGAPVVKPVPNFDCAGMQDTFLHMLAIYNKLPQD